MHRVPASGCGESLGTAGPARTTKLSDLKRTDPARLREHKIFRLDRGTGRHTTGCADRVWMQGWSLEVGKVPVSW
jgi:hypothetical protein